VLFLQLKAPKHQQVVHGSALVLLLISKAPKHRVHQCYSNKKHQSTVGWCTAVLWCFGSFFFSKAPMHQQVVHGSALVLLKFFFKAPPGGARQCF
jgi:hypothetical protein